LVIPADISLRSIWQVRWGDVQNGEGYSNLWFPCHSAG